MSRAGAAVPTLPIRVANIVAASVRMARTENSCSDEARYMEAPCRKEIGKMEPDPIVYVVDDDTSICRAMKRLVNSIGLKAEAYNSPHAFMEAAVIPRCGCMVLDVKMPEMTGFDFYERLAELGRSLPVIFMTATRSSCDTERAKHMEAIAYLEKPFDSDILEDAIRRAIEVA